MDIQNATDIRKNWSVTLDSVVHDRPAYLIHCLPLPLV